MADLMIDIKLNPVIYAHHHGFRMIAKSTDLPQAVTDKLNVSNFTRYFTNRQHDEQVQPAKYRFFNLEYEDESNQKKSAYVLARLEAKPDIITHRGLVSAAQLFIICGEENKQIFENSLRSNPAFLIAQIRFFNFNLSTLTKKEVISINPVKLSLPVSLVEEQLNIYSESTGIKGMEPLLSENIMRAIEEKEPTFLYSTRFSDPIKTFNYYCRNLINAQVDYYRQKLSFTTSEFSASIDEYDLVFLHSDYNLNLEKAKKNPNIINLDLLKASGNSLWYLGGDKMREFHRLLSERIIRKSYNSIKHLESYCSFLQTNASDQEYFNLRSIINDKDQFLLCIKDLRGEIISNDLLRFIKQFNLEEESTKKADKLQPFIKALCVLSAQSADTSLWPNN